MNRKDVGQLLFLITASALAVFAAYMVGEATIWTIIFIISAGVAVIAAYLFFGKPAPGSSSAIPAPVVVPQHLKARLAERVAEANNRINIAKQKRTESQTALTDAERQLGTASTASPQDTAAIATLQEAFRQRQQDFNEAEDIVRFEESQLDKLMKSEGLQGMLDRFNWGTVLQYAIFASLALYVLIHLMHGITSSPPAGTTPRSLITLLISVVVVGIALILVLSTVVSEKIDDKRFSQGKEVLTALLGVLGTIVGFYFGTSQDQASSFTFDPVDRRIRMAQDSGIFQRHGKGAMSLHAVNGA